MKTLTLSLKKQWFDMIKAGIKKEEYREIKTHYIRQSASVNGKIPICTDGCPFS